MSGKKGYDYEHTLADLVATATDGELIPLGTGYNGQYSEAIDLLIDDGSAVHVFELKRTGTDAKTLYWDEDDVQTDDMYNLLKFAVTYPRPTYPYIGVRFNNRQLVLVKLYVNDFPDRDDSLQTAVQLCPIEAKQTHAGNLRLYKPDASDWQTTDLDDHDPQHVLDTINYQL
jgi:Holliday junction resolvase